MPGVLDRESGCLAHIRLPCRMELIQTESRGVSELLRASIACYNLLKSNMWLTEAKNHRQLENTSVS